MSALGDIVHALPVLAALREAFPLAEIDWLVDRP
jgi:ADP-heptose:LPS heptosyltransferase